ncbi:MAG: MarR family transcriptional regulator [Planctomycetota bacterium]
MTSLREQIGKRHAFDLPEEEAYLNVIRTAALFTCEFNRLFKAHGLGESGYNVLRILRAAGDEGRTWTAIHDDLVVPAPDVTRLVGRLERDGLVTRKRSTDDRRVIRVFVTPKGTKLVDSLDGPIRDLHKTILGHLTADQLQELSRALEIARQSLEGDPASNGQMKTER